MDVEKARELLREIAEVAVDNRVHEALRALDGDGAEETWTAWCYSVSGGRCNWCVSDHAACRTIAKELDEADARRIARLPALERAAHKVHDRYFHGDPRYVTRDMDDAFMELDAALTDKES